MSAYERTLNVARSIQFTVPLLVWPVPLTTLVVLGFRCYREKRFCDSLPLLAAQLNSFIIWGALALAMIAQYNALITGTNIVKGPTDSPRNIMIAYYLFDLV